MPQERQSYANAFAMFQRISPPAPQGWELRDDPKNGILDDEICADGRPVTQWSFTRSYTSLAVAARQAEAVKKIQAVMQNAEAVRTANEAELAAIQKQIDANTQKSIALAAAQKFAEMDAVAKDTARLMEEQKKLRGSDAMDAENNKIAAEAERDTAATFNVIIGSASSPSVDGFEPWTAPVGKAYRQDYQKRSGNAEAHLLVILPAKPGQTGPTVLHVIGDPGRAEALVKAAKLQ